MKLCKESHMSALRRSGRETVEVSWPRKQPSNMDHGHVTKGGKTAAGEASGLIKGQRGVRSNRSGEWIECGGGHVVWKVGFPSQPSVLETGRRWTVFTSIVSCTRPNFSSCFGKALSRNLMSDHFSTDLEARKIKASPTVTCLQSHTQASYITISPTTKLSYLYRDRSVKLPSITTYMLPWTMAVSIVVLSITYS